MEKRDTKSIILLAAVEVFARKGYEKATMDEIAAKANIAKGTIFYNFKSKEEIFFEIIEKGANDFGDLVRKKTVNGITSKEKLLQAFDNAFEFLDQYNDYCTLLVSELWRIRTRWNYEPTTLLESFRKRMEEIFSDGQNSGEFRQDLDAHDIGLLVFFLISISIISRSLSADENLEPKMHDQLRKIFTQGVMA
jgi:TetR/AcrR family transcriptional regulator